MLDEQTEKVNYNEIAKVEKPVGSEAKEDISENPEKFTIAKEQVVEPKKKGMFERLVVGLAGPNGVKGIAGNLYNEVIVPAVKQTMFDSIQRGFYQMIFGADKTPPGGYGYGRRENYTAYSQPATRSATVVETVVPRNQVKRYYLKDHYAAEELLLRMREYAGQYDVILVADYMEMLGQPSTFTHNSFGWTRTQLENVRIIPDAGAYFLELPTPVQVGGKP